MSTRHAYAVTQFARGTFRTRDRFVLLMLADAAEGTSGTGYSTLAYIQYRFEGPAREFTYELLFGDEE